MTVTTEQTVSPTSLTECVASASALPQDLVADKKMEPIKPKVAETTSSRHPHLPVELWGLVLHHVDDDFDLWVTCRQVSRTFRAEAEREFAKIRLPDLDITWMADDVFDYQGRPHIYELGIEVWEFQGLRENGHRIQLDIKIECEVYDGDWRSGHSAALDEELGLSAAKDVIIDVLAHRDLDYKQNSRLCFDTCQIAELGCYTSDVQIPGLIVDIDAESLSFEWKTFMNDFFKSTADVRKQTPITTSPFDLAEESLNELFYRNLMGGETKELLAKFGDGDYALCDVGQDWKDTFGEEHSAAFQSAYIQRLKSAHAQAGLNFDPKYPTEEINEKELKNFVRKHCFRTRASINKKLFEGYRQRHDNDLRIMFGCKEKVSEKEEESSDQGEEE